MSEGKVSFGAGRGREVDVSTPYCCAVDFERYVVFGRRATTGLRANVVNSRRRYNAVSKSTTASSNQAYRMVVFLFGCACVRACVEKVIGLIKEFSFNS